MLKKIIQQAQDTDFGGIIEGAAGVPRELAGRGKEFLENGAKTVLEKVPKGITERFDAARKATLGALGSATEQIHEVVQKATRNNNNVRKFGAKPAALDL